MNAPHRLFVISHPALRTAGALACLGIGLGGCQTDLLTTAPVDPKSPVAAEVARISHETGPYPTFQSIPPRPTDLRPLKAWGQAARKIEVAAAELERDTAPSTWTLDGTETFAAKALRQVGPPPSGPESTTAMTEAYAKELRKRATPPPPPKR